MQSLQNDTNLLVAVMATFLAMLFLCRPLQRMVGMVAKKLIRAKKIPKFVYLAVYANFLVATANVSNDCLKKTVSSH